FTYTTTTDTYTLSLHDALPISPRQFENTPGEETRTWGHLSMSGCAETSGRKNKEARASSADLALESAASSSKNRTPRKARSALRSEEHTSELQSRFDLVCRLLL